MEAKDYPTPIYETTGHVVERRIFGGQKDKVTLHLKPEVMDGVLDSKPGLHTYIIIASKVVLMPGVLRGNN
jgi:hypothetical protein